MTDTLDEAYQRLHTTGPEFDGWLSNHGPMATEAMVRHGHGDAVGGWLDRYMLRLEDFPRGIGPLGPDWQSALGDPRRIADWTAHFRRELASRPWQQVLNDWWPRLLPGLIAAATHGVIRVGHSVRCLLADGDDEVRRTELAHGLAYWAARWQSVPAGHLGAASAAAAGRASARSASDLLAAVPRIAAQEGGIGDRLSRLDALPGWPDALHQIGVPGRPDQVRSRLTELVDAAVYRYLSHGHGNGIMLVHSVTAPNAVLRVLPALDERAWAASLAAAWAASSALTATYAPPENTVLPGETVLPGGVVPPAESVPADGRGAICADTFDRAVEHGDEHVIKFADTAIEVFGRSGNPVAIAAAHRAMDLIER
ncbi:MAG: questin oxidase family protein [Streptosporangiaceae bacterium]